ncbi:MAG: nitrate reductase [Planctomycetaceae bacterium]|nr:nitrate reductase [Planctomycetaceae bacterium]
MNKSNQLPPNQQLAAPGKWPFVGEREPRKSDAAWIVSVEGLVEEPRTWTLDELLALPQVERAVDIHCVTRWLKLGARFRGVLLKMLLELARPKLGAAYISFVARSERDHSTSLPLEDALALETLVAFEYEGEPLDVTHGGPVRTIVPDRYFYKSLKWLERIEVLAEDRLGYWENGIGYHNVADPWQEQRFIAPNLKLAEVRDLMERRDFSGRDLRGIQCEKRDLAGLNARDAALRDAHFERADLSESCFVGANLSNAHFQGAKLCSSKFAEDGKSSADAEGANFCGADLRAADLRGVSLFGATFFPLSPREPWGPAFFDKWTRIDEAAIQTLAATPEQESYVRGVLSLLHDDRSE